MTDYPDKLQRTLFLLEMTEDRSELIELLTSYADRFREVPGRIAVRPFPAENKAPNCESEAYVWAEDQPDGTLRFHFAVENPQGIYAKTMAVILDETLSGLPLDQVANVPLDLPLKVFGSELSTGKNMGLTGMLSLVRMFARQRM